MTAVRPFCGIPLPLWVPWLRVELKPPNPSRCPAQHTTGLGSYARRGISLTPSEEE